MSGGNLKVVGAVCGNQFYIKRLPVSEPFFPNATPVAPTGGKDTHFLVENLEDTAFLAQLVRAVCDALPPPKPKKRKEKGTNSTVWVPRCCRKLSKDSVSK